MTASTKSPTRTCKLPGCSNEPRACGWCNKHYQNAKTRQLDPARCTVEQLQAALEAAPVGGTRKTAALPATADVWPKEAPPDDEPMLVMARAVGMVDAGDLTELAARVVRQAGELQRYKQHLDDIRCDILDAGHKLGDDTDPELTPRRLVRELLEYVREVVRDLNEAAKGRETYRADRDRFVQQVVDAWSALEAMPGRPVGPADVPLARVIRACGSNWTAEREEAKRLAALLQELHDVMDQAGVGREGTPAERLRTVMAQGSLSPAALAALSPRDRRIVALVLQGLERLDVEDDLALHVGVLREVLGA